MSEIREGIKLKKVEQTQKEKKTTAEATDIGEILRRRMAIAGSDTDESFGGSEDEDDEAWHDDGWDMNS